MMQRIMHTCPNCGRRFKCIQDVQSGRPATTDFLAYALDSHVELSATRAYPTLRYEVFWGIKQISDALLKTLAFWIPCNAVLLGVSMHNDWPPAIPQIFSVASLVAFLRIFGKVPDWHNHVEQEPPIPPVETEPEDTRQFAGWPLTVVNQTKTTMQLKALEDWYTPPCPIADAMSYALAVVNNHFQWVSERKLKEFKAKISGSNYRLLRTDWIGHKWCKEVGKETIVTDRRMILKIAFDKPE